MAEGMVPEDLPYRAVLTAIIQRFMVLVGAPAALSLARRVRNLYVDEGGNVLVYDADSPIGTVTLLIEQYMGAFGDTALTLSQQAARSVVAPRSEGLLEEVASMSSDVRAIPTRVLIVDDHAMFREGLVQLFNSHLDLRVVGEAGSVREAVSRSIQLRPDVVLMDYGLPDGSGVDATTAILAARPQTKVIFLTVHEDDEHLFSGLRAGAVGYLPKNVRAAELLERVRAVARGEIGITPVIAQRILKEFARRPPAPQIDPLEKCGLTAREIEIVRELARGATNRDIGERLTISPFTVKNHVANVLTKLRLRNRREVAEFVRGQRLASPVKDLSG